MNVIRFENLSVCFRKLSALQEVSLSLQRGEILMLAGPNGAGKTTLLQVLLGLIRADSGCLKVDGDRLRIDYAFKQILGYLPEAISFAGSLTGMQVTRFFASARGVSKTRVSEVLVRVGLREAAKRPVRAYSRGMRQRLGLGLAILHEPELLILDEPTGGLDQEGLNLLWEILEEWRHKNRFVLLSTHELALLESRVDKVCLLKQGAVLAFNTPAVLREQAALPLTVHFTIAEDHGGLSHFLDVLTSYSDRFDFEREYQTLSVRTAPEHLLNLLELKNNYEGLVVRLRVEEPGFDHIYDFMLQRQAGGQAV